MTGPNENREQPIRFVLDGQVVEIDGADPTQTVLQWLREDADKKGTKEGCAEGDCGACTVVVGSLTKTGDVEYRAVNACIYFVPALDGKELITVESLHDPEGELHPVQRALVDHHGSQCGFCTPGFVMSLFALAQNSSQPSRKEIDDALAGNLCRCTGYRPIIAAAENMHRYGELVRETEPTAKQLAELKRDDVLSLQSGNRFYYAPNHLDELATLYSQHPDARLIAGTTDVGLWVTKQGKSLNKLIYLGNIKELQRIVLTDQYLELGAAVTWTDAMEPLLGLYPELESLLLRFAGPPIRNVATIGGNVANASPIGDSMPALMAADAKVVLRRGESQREMPMEQLFQSYQKTALGPGEFIASVKVPARPAHVVYRAYKISKRFDQDISAICGAFRVTLEQDSVADVRIAFGGMAEIPRRAAHVEQALKGKPWRTENVEKAMQCFSDDFTPITDMRASRDYRLRVAQNLLLKFFEESTGGDVLDVYCYGR